MVVISIMGGFYLASTAKLDFALLFHTLFGSWLVAAATNALNQLIERDRDLLMKRTHKRPLPAGRLGTKPVMILTICSAVFGIAYLCLQVNMLTGILSALTLTSYIFIYTPLKKKSPISTIIGAVPGALPAMGGWVAVTNNVSKEAWVLFAILFFWQLPHFLAIAWIYRQDYERGGFPVLTVIDKKGNHTCLHIVINCIALLIVSILPATFGLTGKLYLGGALLLGITFLFFGVQLTIKKSNVYAKYLLHASVAYLPLLILLMFVDKSM
jgi:protoheme IX farnesyltransferase